MHISCLDRSQFHRGHIHLQFAGELCAPSLWFHRLHSQPTKMAVDHSLPDLFVISEVLFPAGLHRVQNSPNGLVFSYSQDPPGQSRPGTALNPLWQELISSSDDLVLNLCLAQGHFYKMLKHLKEDIKRTATTRLVSNDTDSRLCTWNGVARVETGLIWKTAYAKTMSAIT